MPAEIQKKNPTNENFTGNTDPADRGFTVTPDDLKELPFLTRAVYIGGAGNLVCEMKNASGVWSSITFTGLLAGSILPIATRRILSTNTTATFINALW